MKNETNIDAAVINEYTERRIRAYLASMVPRGELSTDEERGRSLIEQIALSAQGDDHPPIRLSADRCADVLDFMASVEPLEPRNWWKSPEDAPCHVTGMTLVLGTLVESLRAGTGTSEPAQPKPEDTDNVTPGSTNDIHERLRKLELGILRASNLAGCIADAAGEDNYRIEGAAEIAEKLLCKLCEDASRIRTDLGELLPVEVVGREES